MTGDEESRDAVLEALDDLITVLSEGSPLETIVSRTELVREHRATGQGYADIVEGRFRPLVVELIGDYIQELIEVSGRLRRIQAATLYAEGMTMEEIARRFGVTRQRISQLLNGA